ncbi:endo-1,4-beta-xylanase [Aquibacillus koreensis]|uniref:Beta-xylanase n=1 Tax=Aquibacillus koreensis TaxID=279446 RepID=A0A9X3WNQ8_9BACI|nr:endo-1,4-beta-xylanase [Aquibacillus koreensis]MCT2535415.1 endo-1,4-beta-xylanase [Aquibacillus koreensis]MDC3422250.1 endo-1,4-beta-xylanase [Aquibacillus koreensis]
MGQINELQHRMGKKTIKLVDASGNPVVDQEVSLTHTNHQFLFGSGIFDAVRVANATDTTENLSYLEDKMDKFFDVFNFGTLPFYWGGFEPEKGNPKTKELKAAAQYLKDRNRNMTVKGHPLCWHTGTAPWLLDMSNEEILKAQFDRIERDVTDFKGLIDMWDVINEVVIMPIFDKYDNGITRISKDLGRVGIVKEMFAKTRESNPNATLLLNDFNTSINYEILIDGCLSAGVPIDAIGIQSHQHQGYWGREKLEQVLERFSHFGLPIHFTENTLISGHIMPAEIEDLNDYQIPEWPSTPEYEARQAKEVEEMYSILFKHPLVEAITNWTFSDDGAWLGAPAGFLRSDNSPKPAYNTLKRLIKQDWNTNLTVKTDSDGMLTFEGFLGDYDLVCGDKKATLQLDKNSETVKLVI